MFIRDLRVGMLVWLALPSDVSTWAPQPKELGQANKTWLRKQRKVYSM